MNREGDEKRQAIEDAIAAVRATLAKEEATARPPKATPVLEGQVQPGILHDASNEGDLPQILRSRQEQPSRLQPAPLRPIEDIDLPVKPPITLQPYFRDETIEWRTPPAPKQTKSAEQPTPTRPSLRLKRKKHTFRMATEWLRTADTSDVPRQMVSCKDTMIFRLGEHGTRAAATTNPIDANELTDPVAPMIWSAPTAILPDLEPAATLAGAIFERDEPMTLSEQISGSSIIEPLQFPAGDITDQFDLPIASGHDGDRPAVESTPTAAYESADSDEAKAGPEPFGSLLATDRLPLAENEDAGLEQPAPESDRFLGSSWTEEHSSPPSAGDSLTTADLLTVSEFIEVGAFAADPVVPETSGVTENEQPAVNTDEHSVRLSLDSTPDNEDLKVEAETPSAAPGAKSVAHVISSGIASSHTAPEPTVVDDNKMAELVRPLLMRWFNENMPRIIETALQNEGRDMLVRRGHPQSVRQE